MQHYVVNAIVGNKPFLDESDQRHAIKVMRSQIGERFVAIYANRRHLCEIISLTPFEARVLSVLDHSNEPQCAITAILAVIKPDRFEFAVQKCTEAGVARIIPVISSRCQPYRLNMPRLGKIAKEAAEQAHREIVPVIDDPISLHDALTSCKGPVYFLTPDAVKGLPKELGQDLG